MGGCGHGFGAECGDSDCGRILSKAVGGCLGG